VGGRKLGLVRSPGKAVGRLGFVFVSFCLSFAGRRAHAATLPAHAATPRERALEFHGSSPVLVPSSKARATRRWRGRPCSSGGSCCGNARRRPPNTGQHRRSGHSGRRWLRGRWGGHRAAAEEAKATSRAPRTRAKPRLRLRQCQTLLRRRACACATCWRRELHGARWRVSNLSQQAHARDS
jgi:hypothetical protein